MQKVKIRVVFLLTDPLDGWINDIRQIGGRGDSIRIQQNQWPPGPVTKYPPHHELLKILGRRPVLPGVICSLAVEVPMGKKALAGDKMMFS